MNINKKIFRVEKLSNLAETCQLLGHKVKNIQLENGILVNLVAPYQNLIKYNSQEELIQVENLFEVYLCKNIIF